jgi:hypothetical protein
METALEARILGPLEALVGGRRVEIKGRKQRELLAILLLRANEIVQPDVLIEDSGARTARPPRSRRCRRMSHGSGPPSARDRTLSRRTATAIACA